MSNPQQPITARLGVDPARLEDLPPVLASRRTVALLWARNADQVRRHCGAAIVACDVQTRAPLYDADQAGTLLVRLRRCVA